MKLLLDSDFLFALFVASDPHHKKAKNLAIDLANKKVKFYVLSLAIQETATVLSHKINQKSAILFTNNLFSLNANIIFVGEQLESSSWNIFLKQSKKGTSFVDCANIATLEEFKLDGILSFDKFYPKGLTKFIRTKK